ncbi:MAG: DUF2121 domain-containing protein [Methanothrix sp.]|nr:DUF2121 domain-containing protein [Methanothrix sp.]
MSLVIALAASRQAVIAADRRSILFLGSCQELEAELYSGQIKDDRELEARAEALGAVLQVSDGREKVWRLGDVLVGEVTEISPRQQRHRRIYIAPGASLQVEIRSGEGAGLEPEAKGGEARIKAWGGVGCTVFGNRFTQKLAAEEIARTGSRVDESLIQRIFQRAAEKTASVSCEHTILKSNIISADARTDLLAALQADCKECGWRLCGPQ